MRCSSITLAALLYALNGAAQAVPPRLAWYRAPDQSREPSLTLLVAIDQAPLGAALRSVAHRRLRRARGSCLAWPPFPLLALCLYSTAFFIHLFGRSCRHSLHNQRLQQEIRMMLLTAWCLSSAVHGPARPFTSPPTQTRCGHMLLRHNLVPAQLHDRVVQRHLGQTLHLGFVDRLQSMHQARHEIVQRLLPGLL